MEGYMVTVNREIMEHCSELTGYVRLVQYIRDYRAQGHANEEAVDLAIRRCVEENCLAEYLTKLRREAKYMSIWTEFDEEAYEQGIREGAYEEAYEEAYAECREETKREDALPCCSLPLPLMRLFVLF